MDYVDHGIPEARILEWVAQHSQKKKRLKEQKSATEVAMGGQVGNHEGHRGVRCELRSTQQKTEKETIPRGRFQN